MKLTNFKKEKQGFTIIEMIIAISIFSLVITVGIGALMNAYKVHKKTSNFRSVMDNLNFVIEDMTRTIRTGSNYNCESSGGDCPGPIGYNLDLVDQYGQSIHYHISPFGVQKEVTTSTFDSNYSGNMTDSVISFDIPKSGFKVFGSSAADHVQPLVVIKLAGYITIQGETTPFFIQTSVSQRTLDVPGAFKITSTGGDTTGDTTGSSGLLPSNATNYCAETLPCGPFSYDSLGYYSDGTSYYGNSFALTASHQIVCDPSLFHFDQSISGGGCYFTSSSDYNTSSDYMGKLPAGVLACGDSCTYLSDSVLYYGVDPVYYALLNVTGQGSTPCDYKNFNLKTPIEGASCFMASSGGSSDYGGGSSDYGIPGGATTCVSQDGVCSYDFSGMESGGTAYYGNSSSDYTLSISKIGDFVCNPNSFKGQFIDRAWCAVSPNGPGCYRAFDASGNPSDPICN